MHSKKYKLVKIEELRRHNPLYDGIEGRACYLAYLKVGERGWILYQKNDYDWPHRIHTSIVKDVNYTRGNQVIVTTQNTRFTFEVT